MLSLLQAVFLPRSSWSSACVCNVWVWWHLRPPCCAVDRLCSLEGRAPWQLLAVKIVEQDESGFSLIGCFGCNNQDRTAAQGGWRCVLALGI